MGDSTVAGTRDPWAPWLALVQVLARRRVRYLEHCRKSKANPSDPDQEIAWAESDPEMQEWRESLSSSPQAMAAIRALPSDLRKGFAGLSAPAAETGESPIWHESLSRLVELYGLSAPEQGIVLLGAAFHAQPGLAGQLLDWLEIPAPHLPLLARYLFVLGPEWRLRATSALRGWEIIRWSRPWDGGSGPARIDPTVFDWLEGRDSVPPELLGRVRLRGVSWTSETWPVAEWTQRCKRYLSGSEPSAGRIVVEAAPGTGRRSFAAEVCRTSGLRLLEVTVPAASLEPEQIRMVYRQAYWLSAAPCWHGEAPSWAGAESPALFPFEWILADAQREVEDSPPETMTRASGINRVRLPATTMTERAEALKKHWPAAKQWPMEKCEWAAARFPLPMGRWFDVMRSGANDLAELEQAAEAESTITQYASVTPLRSGFRWSDLVLPESLIRSLHEFAEEASVRAEFWRNSSARRLYPQGRGLSALFSGPPGTGKTMSAMVLANQLELELWRVDLSLVVSKWVGETSKNLSKMLDSATEQHVMLFFDEADALFGKRTEVRDAQDRFANSDTGFLLQAVEQFPGILLLSTNKKQNIDPAFLRRMRYLFQYRNPTVLEREMIFRKVIGELGDGKAVTLGDVDPARLAALWEFSGSQIKQSVLHGAMLSRARRVALDQSLILNGIRRELEKTGQSLDERVVERAMGGPSLGVA